MDLPLLILINLIINLLLSLCMVIFVLHVLKPLEVSVHQFKLLVEATVIV